MFAGKTKALLAWVTDLRDWGFEPLLLKPTVDTRYSTHEVVAHSGERAPAQLISNEGICDIPQGVRFIAVDEAQFLNDTVVNYLIWLVEHGRVVCVAGLDLTSQGQPFGQMPKLLAYADHVTKLRGICARCGSPSTRSQNLTSDRNAVLVGGADCYEPRCLSCFSPDEGTSPP